MSGTVANMFPSKLLDEKTNAYQIRDEKFCSSEGGDGTDSCSEADDDK